MSSFSQLLAGGLATLRQAAGDPATYQRGALSVALSSVLPGKSEYETTDSFGMTTTAEANDWIFAAAELVLDGELTTPLPGDQIVINGATFELVDLPGRNCYSGSDPQGSTIRCHTKAVL